LDSGWFSYRADRRGITACFDTDANLPPEDNMNRMRSTIILIIAIACCCIFFAPGFRYALSDDGQVKRETTQFSMGIPMSPWWSYDKSVINGEMNDSKFNFHILSVSWLFLLAAIVLFVLRHKSVRSPSETSHENAG
jgi:hypothetical protein